MADNAICWVAAFGVLVLRFREQRSRSGDRASTYRTLLFNPLAFCAASGFVVVRSALRHPVQGLILTCFLGGSVAATRLVKGRRPYQNFDTA